MTTTIKGHAIEINCLTDTSTFTWVCSCGVSGKWEGCNIASIFDVRRHGVPTESTVIDVSAETVTVDGVEWTVSYK